MKTKKHQVYHSYYYSAMKRGLLSREQYESIKEYGKNIEFKNEDYFHSMLEKFCQENYITTKAEFSGNHRPSKINIYTDHMCNCK